jgi:23S rRNA pseudouridine1911/1915/1917 synthase
VAERFGHATVLRCRLETGRTHQIRVHLSALGHPLVGDPVYGKRSGIAFPRQALHAERLQLLHPRSGKHMEWQADPPADLQALIKQLRNAEKHQSQTGLQPGGQGKPTRHRSRVER